MAPALKPYTVTVYEIHTVEIHVNATSKANALEEAARELETGLHNSDYKGVLPEDKWDVEEDLYG